MGNKWDPVVGTEEYNENLVRINKIAQENGYVLNSDRERLRKVVGLMTMNKIEFGDYYCPCKQSHPLDVQKDVLCPCPEMKNEIAKDNHCFCQLFYILKGV
ncbi:MAG: ferredoxin:thioredoxin reductase [candidate division WOR-3 bacterium]|nr:MAG: ferredoxin:thioredoxin reductase [candidate division WOR-3 bacterium]